MYYMPTLTQRQSNQRENAIIARNHALKNEYKKKVYDDKKRVNKKTKPRKERTNLIVYNLCVIEIAFSLRVHKKGYS